MILVTGATGLLGSRLVDRLASEGMTVRVLVRERCSELPWGRELMGSIDCMIGSVTELDVMRRAAVGVDTIMHLAAIGSPSTGPESAAEMMYINTGGTANAIIAAASAGVRKFVLASSAAVYGNPSRSPIDESLPLSPVSAYGVSKRAAEELCRVYGEQLGVPTISVRFFNLYGTMPRREEVVPAAIPSFIRAIQQGAPIVLRAEGRQRRDFLHVDDAVEALVLVLRTDRGLPRVVNVGSGVAVSVREVVDIIANQLALRDLTIKEEPIRPGDVMESLADIALARGTLGFHPRISIEEGITRMTLSGGTPETKSRLSAR